MRLLLVILLFTLLVISQLNTIVSIDLWWNLKTGEYIIENLRVPRADLYSYILEDKEWIDHEWLSQVVLYFIFDKFGWLGLNILKSLVIALCFLVLFFLILNRYKINIFLTFFSLLSILSFGYRSFVRPEIFSYLLLCIYLYVLEREKKLWILVPLQILWVNLHGYFILGPIILFLYFIGEFLHGDRSKAKRFGKVFIFLVFSCFLNPYFYKGALYPVKILLDVFSEQKISMQNVQELLMPIRSSFSKMIFFWVFVILSSLTFLVNIKKVRLAHLFIFGLAFLASYMAIRNIPIFIFIGMSVAIINLDEANFNRKIYHKNYYPITILAVFILGHFFLSNEFYKFINQYPLRKTESKFSELLMPKGACDFIEDNKIKGRIFNTLDFGPYIGYRFYPERRVFIDSRTDLYKDDFLNLYLNALNYPEKWRMAHEKYNFDIAVLRHIFSGTERIIRFLYKDNDWKLVYYDENSCIFLNNTAKNSRYIEKFNIDFRRHKLNARDINIRIADFFGKLGQMRLSEEIYVELLKKDPDFLEAGNNLAGIYINTGRFDEAIEILERFLERHPKKAELYANLGTAYLHMGKEKEALFLLEKAARLDPYLRRASYMLGLVYLHRDEIDRATRQLEKYSKLDPYNPEVHRILGDIYTQKGLLEKAELEYNERDALRGL